MSSKNGRTDSCVIERFSARAVAFVANFAALRKSPPPATEIVSPLRTARRQVIFQARGQVDDRRLIRFARLGKEVGGRELGGARGRVEIVDRREAQVEQVPIAPHASNMAQRGSQRLARPGADRSVERTPIGLRIGEDANLADQARLAHHGQRDDSRHLAAFTHDEHSQPLDAAVVPPVRFQPFERLKERRVRGLSQQHPPRRTKLAERCKVLDFFNARHGDRLGTT